MSLISPSRCLPLVWMLARKFCRTLDVRVSPSSISSSEKPRMALRGVRSSWLMPARNLLLWRLASFGVGLPQLLDQRDPVQRRRHRDRILLDAQALVLAEDRR